MISGARQYSQRDLALSLTKSRVAARLARDGDPEPIDFEETDTNFAIGWKGNYRIDGRTFVCADRESGRIITILGYPTARIAQLG
jgi:hypothetical protein